MATPRSRKVMRALAGAGALLVVGAIGMYAINPSGTASSDPRARILAFETYRIASSSMSPTLQVGDLVVASTWAYSRQPPRRGDVVVYYPADQPETAYVSRVAAVGGDVLSIREGVLHVGGVAVREPYLDPATLERPESRTLEDVVVPDGALYVLGDNRDHSEDSRHRGVARVDAVVGRIARIMVARGDGEREGVVD